MDTTENIEHDDKLTKLDELELDRASADMLPAAIVTVANLSLFAGVIVLIYGVVSKEFWTISLALSGILSAPFLYGFADIVRSLRTMTRKSLGG